MDSAPSGVCLSLVIPTFNASQDLPRLLGSISAPDDVEIIIVDDGSTDDTRRLIREFVKSQAGALSIFLSHVGPGAARSVGMQRASGRYLAFADSDDAIDVPMLLEGCREADAQGADVVIFEYERRHSVHPPDLRASRASRFNSVPWRRVLTSRAAIWGKIYRTSFLRTHAIDFLPLRSADDVLFTWEVASHRPVILACPDVAYYYYVFPHNQLTRDTRYFLDGVASLAILLDRARKRGTRPRLLALYAWGSGTIHIIRKVPSSRRLDVLRRSSAALLQSVLPHLRSATS